MTLLYTEIEEDLRASVRDLLADRCGPGVVLRRVESATPYDAELWKTLAQEIGVAGLLVPEEHGGAGASARETAVVLEELGRAVAPLPFLTSSVLAVSALLGSGDGLLGALAAGEATAALVVPFAVSPYRFAETATVRDGVLSGQVRAVAGADVADVLLVPAGGGLYAVDAADATVEVVPSLDLTRPIATVTLSSAPGRRIEGADGGDVRRALLTGAGLLASEQLGVAEWCLNTTLAYIKERHQFARPVGSFQAIKHRMADLWLDVVRARAAARNAAHLLAGATGPAVGGDERDGQDERDGRDGQDGRDTELAVAVAKSWCSEVALRVAEESVQLHGGIGMTWEHPVHLYLKRAKAGEIALGTPGVHRDAVAVLADLPGPVA
ncbi:alkylation response protein AidB-like acyl-CoA dehydrogenase [Streptosporangium becharense]|uniref:Alkylation response protein AidB-like acyl-CoA dehydrogenase n=1 Tax=Streptosporangium becharense TaxID=1816182 RepID=A0A7W9IKH2_9ACTN|nr:acyl-CoA dehydrogenase family protein [Streptosporangium becharense]MBB2911203.1 alkylation response protein AidB-like acyl-CoA dehydrogenase [Streptosporangium becharense]MBB5821739.1 alkylation response protein AidB-like acyl-CoA dehydrogenase [Streptosporangium becharense]